VSVVLRPSSAFPPGTSVAAYPESNWAHHLRPPSGAPVGSATETDTVAADGTLTFADLTETPPTRYYAYAEVSSGVHRYVGFTAGSNVSEVRDANAIHGHDIPAPGSGEDGKGFVYDHDTGAYVWTDLATQAELDAKADALDRDNGHTGMFVAPPGGARAVVALTAGRAYAMRFVPSRNMTISSIAFQVTTAAGADDTCDVGIYDSALTTRLVSKGATAGLLNVLGVKNVDIGDTALTAGTVYYAAFSSVTPFGAAAAQLLFLSLGVGSGGTFFGTTAGVTEVAFKDASHPLPASLAGFGTTAGSAPLFALRES
jgi:hypothetical protein